jgi:hypothetical protein
MYDNAQAGKKNKVLQGCSQNKKANRERLASLIYSW